MQAGYAAREPTQSTYRRQTGWFLDSQSDPPSPIFLPCLRTLSYRREQQRRSSETCGHSLRQGINLNRMRSPRASCTRFGPFQSPREKKLRLADVKEMFLQMGDHV